MNSRTAPRALARGMTLIEILVVLVILSLIATAVAVNVVGRAEKARVDRAKTDVQRIASDGVEAFKVMRGRYPTTPPIATIMIGSRSEVSAVTVVSTCAS